MKWIKTYEKFALSLDDLYHLIKTDPKKAMLEIEIERTEEVLNDFQDYVIRAGNNLMRISTSSSEDSLTRFESTIEEIQFTAKDYINGVRIYIDREEEFVFSNKTTEIIDNLKPEITKYSEIIDSLRIQNEETKETFADFIEDLGIKDEWDIREYFIKTIKELDREYKKSNDKENYFSSRDFKSLIYKNFIEPCNIRLQTNDDAIKLFQHIISFYKDPYNRSQILSKNKENIEAYKISTSEKIQKMIISLRTSIMYDFEKYIV